MAKKTVVKVNFVDGSTKAFALDKNDTTKTLYDILVAKIGIVQHQHFALFERKDEWERCLELDDHPVLLSESWEDKTHSKFIYKKKVFIRTDDEKEMEDPIAKDLLYKQVHHSVICSDYHCATAESALKLAGLQMQIAYGEHNSLVHIPGFLTTNESIKNFIPKHLFSGKKPSEWEALILRQHSMLSPTKRHVPEDAKTEYIKFVRTFEHYGTTFFPPCKTVSSRVLPSKVVIGVNYEGIKTFKTKTKDAHITKHLFTDIYSWSSSASTFAFEYGTQYECTKFTFETKHGAIIAGTIQSYIDILVQLLKNGDSEDEESETVSSEK